MLTAALASHSLAQYSIIYNVTIPMPAYAKPHCALALDGGKLLVAGYTGQPPRAYAAVIDLKDGRVSPLPVPGLEGSTRSEILGCVSTLLGPLLYGYVQYANGSLSAYFWLYRGGALTPVKLKHVTIIPIHVLVKPPLTYIVGFLGACGARGVVSAAYVLQGSLEDILAGRYDGRIYMPGLRATNTSVYQVIGGKAYRCVYFVGLYQLPTGDVEVVGYAINATSGVGLTVRLDSLLQVVENVTLQPLLPVSYADAGQYGVAVGYLIDGSVGIAVYSPDGSVRYARVKYSGIRGSVYPEDISCQENLCVIGGYAALNNSGKTGIIMFAGISDDRVTFVKTYTWDRVEEVPAVYISPAGTVYLIGLTGGGLRILAISLPSQGVEVQGAGGAEATGGAIGINIAIPLSVIAVSAVILAIVLLHRSRRRR